MINWYIIVVYQLGDSLFLDNSIMLLNVFQILVWLTYEFFLGKERGYHLSKVSEMYFLWEYHSLNW